jgi:hypothetical protein
MAKQQGNDMRRSEPKKGDYVVATKYDDGDPGDQFCIGFYDGSYDHYGQTRHLVIDSEGKNFRANGFRRVALVGPERGAWMVRHVAFIERMRDRFSVWHWYRAPWRELRAIPE